MDIFILWLHHVRFLHLCVLCLGFFFAASLFWAVTQHMGLQQSFTALLKTQQSAALLINFIPELRMLL